MPAPSRPSRVLILANEPMGAALLGLLLEGSAYEPAFAHPGESPEAALKRVRPPVVILLDGAVDVARSDLFYTRAERRGVRVILYGRAADSAAIATLASERGLSSFALPISPADLAALIGAAMDGGDMRRGTRRASVAPTRDGLVFTDRRGRRWFVYDRRAVDRRADERSEPLYRAFVNDAGEEWRYGFARDEPPATSAAMLERQLASALRVSALETPDPTRPPTTTARTDD